jgi:magnesium transporter
MILSARTAASHDKLYAGERSRSCEFAAYLYDADGLDQEVDLNDDGLPKLKGNMLLWIDLTDKNREHLETAARLLDLPPELVRALEDDEPQPTLVDYKDFLHVRVVDLSDQELVPVALDAVAGRNWLLTLQRCDGEGSEAFRAVFRGETELGRLDSLSFLAALLDSQVGGYFAAIARIEQRVDGFDEEILRAEVADGEASLTQLVGIRRDLATLRRHLVLHRETYTRLGDPALTVLGSEQSAARFQALLARLERAVDGAESARQMVGGSFEILMNRTSQRTNNIVKLLTLVSAALLPSSVLAGVLGMNFKQPFFDLTFLFWVVVGLMATLILGVIAIASRRNWL